MIRSTGLVLLSLGLATGLATAQSLDCDTAVTQLDMNQCAHQEWQAADAELNVEYRKARTAMREMDANLPEAQRGAAIALRDAQRAWIVYRDLACAAEGWMFRGGSMEPLIVSTCLTALTEERINGLKTLSETN